MLKNLNKRRNLLGTIYAIFMLMPLLSVLVTCIYVQLNHNAFESYYGSTINESLNVDVSYSQLRNNQVYYLQPQSFSSESSYTFFEVYIYGAKNITTNVDYDGSIYNRIRVYKGNNSQIYTQLMRADQEASLTITTNQTIEFTFNSPSQNGTITQFIDIWQVEYNKYSYLDNAFDYSIYRVTNGNRGNIDFTSTLFSFFLSNNEVNNLYIGFINYYINYTLLVSCIYFLYLVLMWFITFIKNLIFRYMGE